mmetsp:Transcript_1291/g.1159  ORF Transcript_1291/g.1159 Transcript_1291/m.1159 type:complete len:170 (+) Transcript_1291:455-964(+)
MSLLIPLDKDKARTEIAYLRRELKTAREDIRRLNIRIKKKKGAKNDKSMDLVSKSQLHNLSDNNFQEISTEDGYKTNSKYYDKAINFAESALGESKYTNKNVSEIGRTTNTKAKSFNTWKEDEGNDDLMSEELLISEINHAIKDSNNNVQKMLDESRHHLARSGIELLK